MVIASTISVFCALGDKARNIKMRKQAVWIRDYFIKTVFDTLRHVRHEWICCKQQIFMGHNALAVQRVVSCRAKWNVGFDVSCITCCSYAIKHNNTNATIK